MKLGLTIGAQILETSGTVRCLLLPRSVAFGIANLLESPFSRQQNSYFHELKISMQGF